MLDIYVINLKERDDRWEHIVKTFGKDFNLIRVDAIKHENGHIGCFLSHKKCLEIAKEKGLQNIIVMEDDCTINPSYEKFFIKRIEQIKNYLNLFKDWDIFLGGINGTEPNDIVKKIDCEVKNLIQITKAYTTHFMIYNNSSYDFFLNFDETKGIPIDCVWHNKLVALTVLPFLASQLPGHSDIINTHTNYYRKIKNTQNKLLNYINQNNI